MGFPRSSISKWNDNIPSVLKVKKVAEYFGVAIDDLISDKDEGNE
nr:MAG TPA: helix-turn-helix domain protein [Herelleviridae sp.]DAO85477.1 MAG TPA: helix-turn-helix domain protein [Caudoviricetes sp.]